MYEQIHILSPLVAAREYYFLRICKEIEQGLWIITDVSYDCFKNKHQHQLPSLRSWKLPSGCMIRDMCDGNSEVTWIEHVEVDDRSSTQRVFRDLVCVAGAYGAPRWLSTLERMIERFGSESASNSSPGGKVIHVPEGRRSVMDLSQRMVKSFFEMLSMSSTGKMDLPHLAELNNNGVRVSVRHSDGPGQPGGIIVSATTSLWLPLPGHILFNFLRDEKTRTDWDMLSDGNPVNEIARISCGNHPGNRISVLQPFNPKEGQMMMLQESCIDSSGSVIVYGPIDFPAIRSVINGDDSGHIPILPSGFTISGDGRPDKTNNNAAAAAAAAAASTSSDSSSRSSGASILTVAFQILVCSNLPNVKELSMESVATANTLVSSTVQKIKNALNCHDDQ
ncbi:homeobox-leucine zipper protein ROC8-like [Impatiens glandulifera]|uniref:homeobox-leucine zipper protein ROC8-like n=1 Tax=Impatiens glandulifera TaxID=253017 RepID=UPI001FB13029|nr:homeobox-leucine zipper protein ROC8-like [Impatiens glandulifera]